MERSSTVVYYQKAEARLEREKQDAIRGLTAAKARERIRKQEAAKCKDRSDRFGEQNDEEEEEVTDKEVSETGELTEMADADVEYAVEPSRVARAKWTLKTEECFEIVEPQPAERQTSSHLQSDSMLSILAALGMLVPKRESSDRENELSKFHRKQPTPYERTKLSMLQRARERKREKEREKRLAEEKRRKFFAALSEIKVTLRQSSQTTMLTAEWNRTCHLRERQIMRERSRMKNIARIRWACKMSGLNFSPNCGIYDKILKSIKEKEKQAIARQERMKEILQRINNEMTTKCIRSLMRKRTVLGRDSISMSTLRHDVTIASNLSTRTTRDPDDHIQELSKLLENVSQDSIINEVKQTIEEKSEIVDENLLDKSKEKPSLPETDHRKAKAVGGSNLTSKKKIGKTHPRVSETEAMVPQETGPETDGDTEGTHLDDANLVDKADEITLEEEVQKDTNFYTNPSVVTFKDFKPHKVYTRKVLVINKRSRWAYLTFHKVDTDVWEPVIEIDIDGAAKVKPGLHASFTIIFSPVHSETINADICFLTLSPEHPECFHEFRVPVCCIPEVPAPLVEPREVRFSTAPIWKFNDPKLYERVLTVSNQGGKSFSFTVSKKDNDRQYFFWTFKDGEILSAESFDLEQLYENDEKSLSNDQSNEPLTNIENETYERSVETDAKKMNHSGKLDKKRRIEVPPKVKCRLAITFRPQYVGLHHEVIELCFVENEQIFGKQDVPIWAETVGLQLHLKPTYLDFGILLTDCGVYQRNFDVVNTARTSIEVSAKTPKLLGGQISVHPKTVSIQPETFVTLSLRLVLKSDIRKKCKKYYDSVSNQLQVPIHIQPISAEFEGTPPLILKALATLTSSHALILEPSHVDLEQVYTHEAVLAELSLTNASLVVQDYGFPDLPTFMEIQPNHGFGTILPGETIRLHLVYWPWLTDIPENEIEANGLSGQQRFRIEVVTLTELAGRSTSLTDKPKIPHSRQIKMPNIDVPSGKPVEDMQHVETVEDESYLHNIDQLQEDDARGYTSSDASTDSNDQQYTLRDAVVAPKRSNRKEKSVIDVTAFIVDTLCELSEQVVEFPATPCGSCSTVSLDLRGFNMASYPNCTCGIVKSQTTEFTARYDFRCSSDRVRVNPRNGLLRGNDLVKVTFVFEPKLPKHALLNRAQELKAERIAEELEKAKAVKPRAKNGSPVKKGKGRTTKNGMKENELANGTMELSEMDTLSGEIGLLESFEPRVATVFVTCTINIDLRNGMTRDEVLYGKLVCPIVKPEIIIVNTARDIHFGLTAIGTASRKLLLVKNISSRNVKIQTSPLNPFGPFFIPSGKMIETGTILTLPVTYRPTGNDPEYVEEFFEVSAVGTSTVWRVRVTGQSAVPSWRITPEMLVARLEARPGTVAELKMSIQNTGRCPLTFNLVIIEMLEGEAPLIRPDTGGSSGKRDKRRKKDESAGSEKKASKSIGRSRTEKFGADLYENEVETIYGGRLQPLHDYGIFEFVKFDENMSLAVMENQKVDFVIRFHTPKRGRLSSQRRSSLKKGSSTKGEKVRSESTVAESKRKKDRPAYYVGLFRLMLGNEVFVQDIIVCVTS